MTDIERLTEAAAYLKDRPKVTCNPWPEYDPRVMAVFCLPEDRDYLKNHEKLAGKSIGEMTLHEIAAMYTFITRGERFCDGHIASYIEDGTLYKLVMRHLELLSGSASENRPR